ncbi:hypothetical protein GOP47_0007867 [Adiantum capillus-veneris]|uniref:PFL domain-containing protein n=1 Tax=Adiantum capillus-veneris TaxID=13818 RepID=A0A9D4V1Q9_ADICA|nr:hypothetical protein GOP47_0007867 [Adiantum capillus-veneris]
MFENAPFIPGWTYSWMTSEDAEERARLEEEEDANDMKMSRYVEGKDNGGMMLRKRSVGEEELRTSASQIKLKEFIEFALFGLEVSKWEARGTKFTRGPSERGKAFGEGHFI